MDLDQGGFSVTIAENSHHRMGRAVLERIADQVANQLDDAIRIPEAHAIAALVADDAHDLLFELNPAR